MSPLTCPSCDSCEVVKNGRIHNGKQNHKCRACGRQFVEDPQQKRIDPATKALIDKLLLEKIPLAGIARVCDVSESWLQAYVNQIYEAVPRQVSVSSKKRSVNDSMCWRSLPQATKCGRSSTTRVINSGSG
jgi:transposase-like protein